MVHRTNTTHLGVLRELAGCGGRAFRKIGVILLLAFLPAQPASAELLAVIDRSRPETAQLNADQLSLLVQTARGEAARRLVPLGFTILSEENTISILRDMGVELATCEGECEVEIARKLQADWLMSTKIVRFGETWSLQINLFQAVTGALISSERASARVEDALVEGSERAAGLLCERMGASPAGSSTTLGDLPLETQLIPAKASVTSLGLPTQTGPLPGMSFVTLPAGTFQMGSPVTEAGRERGEVQHAVTLSSFSIMTTEVTQGQWKWVTGENPSKFRGDDLPVESVSWAEVQDFIKRLNTLDPLHVYRLPTEAEWEYACRAGTENPWGFGDEILKASDYAWYVTNSGKTTHSVGTKTPNAWGLYDMHGNVEEICQDFFTDYEKGAQRDPVRNSLDYNVPRLRRGGGYNSEPTELRSAYRGYWRASRSLFHPGFRLARTP